MWYCKFCLFDEDYESYGMLVYRTSRPDEALISTAKTIKTIRRLKLPFLVDILLNKINIRIILLKHMHVSLIIFNLS